LGKKKLGAFDDEDEVQGCVAVSTPLFWYVASRLDCTYFAKGFEKVGDGGEEQSGLIRVGGDILSVAVPRRLRSNPRGAVAPP